MDDFVTGWEHLRSGRLAEAESCYRRFLDGHPDHAEAWAALGHVAFNRQDLDESIRCNLRSLDLSPNVAEVLTNLGVAYAVRRDFVSAEQVFRRAVAVLPPFLGGLSQPGPRTARSGETRRSHRGLPASEDAQPGGCRRPRRTGQRPPGGGPGGRGSRVPGRGGPACAAVRPVSAATRRRAGEGRSIRRGRGRLPPRPGAGPDRRQQLQRSRGRPGQAASLRGGRGFVSRGDPARPPTRRGPPEPRQPLPRPGSLRRGAGLLRDRNRARPGLARRPEQSRCRPGPTRQA